MALSAYGAVLSVALPDVYSALVNRLFVLAVAILNLLTAN